MQQCKSSSISEINLHSSFTVLKKCSCEYGAKIHEALLIKQSTLPFNKQLYTYDCFFLLNIIWFICLVRSQSINLWYLPLFRLVICHHLVVVSLSLILFVKIRSIWSPATSLLCRQVILIIWLPVYVAETLKYYLF